VTRTVPIDPRAAIALEVAGARRAVTRCGPWPVVTTLDEYRAATDRAASEPDRAIEIWGRWRRRYDPDAARLELGSTRLMVRREVALALTKQRAECLRLLTEPAAGAA
jgi:hypothetical protein